MNMTRRSDRLETDDLQVQVSHPLTHLDHIAIDHSYLDEYYSTNGNVVVLEQHVDRDPRQRTADCPYKAKRIQVLSLSTIRCIDIISLLTHSREHRVQGHLPK